MLTGRDPGLLDDPLRQGMFTGRCASASMRAAQPAAPRTAP